MLNPHALGLPEGLAEEFTRFSSLSLGRPIMAYSPIPVNPRSQKLRGESTSALDGSNENKKQPGKSVFIIRIIRRSSCADALVFWHKSELRQEYQEQ